MLGEILHKIMDFIADVILARTNRKHKGKAPRSIEEDVIEGVNYHVKSFVYSIIFGVFLLLCFLLYWLGVPLLLIILLLITGIIVAFVYEWHIFQKFLDR